MDSIIEIYKFGCILLCTTAFTLCVLLAFLFTVISGINILKAAFVTFKRR